MKKSLLGLLGIGAACAACCAIPLALPLLAGFGLAGFGAAGFAIPDFGWIAGIAAATVLLASGIYLWRKRQAAPACSVDASQGCGCASVR